MRFSSDRSTHSRSCPRCQDAGRRQRRQKAAQNWARIHGLETTPLLRQGLRFSSPKCGCGPRPVALGRLVCCLLPWPCQRQGVQDCMQWRVSWASRPYVRQEGCDTLPCLISCVCNLRRSCFAAGKEYFACLRLRTCLESPRTHRISHMQVCCDLHLLSSQPYCQVDEILLPNG